MREPYIKFIAYDTKNKQIFNKVAVSSTDPNERYRNYIMICYSGSWKYIKRIPGMDNIVVCQYSGIRDDNNDRIFEGHVVKAELGGTGSDNKDNSITGVVVNTSHGFSLMHDSADGTSKKVNLEDLSNEALSMKILGNIYIDDDDALNL